MSNQIFGYQYETSPRKIEPEYKKTTSRKKPIQKKSNHPKKKKVMNKKKDKKFKVSFEFKFFINAMMIFSVVFAIIACQAMVEQKYKEKEKLKNHYNELYASSRLKAENEDDIRMYAQEYGMQTKSATLIDLGTSDYIESSTNKVKIDNQSVFEKIFNKIKDIF